MEALTFKSFQISTKRKQSYALAFSNRIKGFLATQFGISVQTATFCQLWMPDRQNKAMTQRRDSTITKFSSSVNALHLQYTGPTQEMKHLQICYNALEDKFICYRFCPQYLLLTEFRTIPLKSCSILQGLLLTANKHPYFEVYHAFCPSYINWSPKPAPEHLFFRLR